MQWNLTDESNPNTVYKCPPNEKVAKDTMNELGEHNYQRVWGRFPRPIAFPTYIQPSWVCLHFAVWTSNWTTPNILSSAAAFFWAELDWLASRLASSDWDPDTLTHNNAPSIPFDDYHPMYCNTNTMWSSSDPPGGQPVITQPQHITNERYGYHKYVYLKVYGVCLELKGSPALQQAEEIASVQIDDYHVFNGELVDADYKWNGEQWE
jgi:hypothetical protein